MLTRPLTLSDSDDRGRGLAPATPPPALPLAAEHDGVFSPSWSSSSSCPPCTSSSCPPCTSSSCPPCTSSSPPCTSSCPPCTSSSSAAPSLTPAVSLLCSLSPPPPPLSCTTSSITPPQQCFAAPPFSAPVSEVSSPSVAPALLQPVPPPSSSAPPPSAPPAPSSAPSPSAPPAPSSAPPAPSSAPLPSSALPPSAPLPCCPCSSLLPRLLTAHRLEVRRLLRGALANLSRRLDSLERRSRRKLKKKRSRQKGGEGVGSACPVSSPSISPAHLPPVSTYLSSSSTDNEDTPTLAPPPPPSSLNQSNERRSSALEGLERRGKKRRRGNHRRRDGCAPPAEEEEEEEEGGRFVGRMVVSFGGGGGGVEEEAPLTLHNFNHRKHRRREGPGAAQSEKTDDVIRPNGYRAPPTRLVHGSSSHNALQLLPSARSQTCSQSEALSLSAGQWRFSDFTTPVCHSSSQTLHLWLRPYTFYSPAPMLQLSAVAMETVTQSLRGGACVSPVRPLKDWTAPPSLSIDHCYIRAQSQSLTFPARRQQKLRTNHSSRSLLLPRRRLLPPCPANGLPGSLHAGQSAASSELVGTNGERRKRVSQIRIRRASPRETPLTPMGLPKVKRLKKKEFSLEEIYTNKNYKSPSTNRSLETIFEEPREKDGALLLIGQQKRRRLLLFPDFTQPRKRKRPQGAGLPVAPLPRKRAAARRHGGGAGDDESDLDVMLVERLSALEDFLSRQGLDV